MADQLPTFTPPSEQPPSAGALTDINSTLQTIVTALSQLISAIKTMTTEVA